MSFWKRQTEIRNLIKQQEDALGTRQAPVAPVRPWGYLQAQQFDQAMAAARERERVASAQHQARQQAVHVAEQAAQRVHAERGRELHVPVVELQRALAGAEARVHGDVMDDCVRAAAEALVYRARLEAAQAAYAEHMNPQGWRPPAASATR